MSQAVEDLYRRIEKLRARLEDVETIDRRDIVTEGHNHTSTIGDGGALTNDEHDGYSEYAEIAAPSSPAADKLRLYAKDVSGATTLATKRSDGVEVTLADFMTWLGPACQCAEADAQTISNNSATPVTFGDADVLDTDALHDPGSNPSRVTLRAGCFYEISGGGTFSSGSGSGRRELYLRVGGATELPGSRDTFRQSDSNDAPGLHSHAYYYAAVATYVELVAYQNSGGDRTLSNQTLTVRRVSGA